MFNEGDTGESFYIIEDGEVECLKKLGENEYEVVRTLK